MPDVIVLEKSLEQIDDPGADLAMAGLWLGYRHDPSAHKLLGIARVRPLGELFGGEQWCEH